MKNIAEYNEIHIILEYGGSFFVGHDYGVDRLSSILEGPYDGSVVYMSSESINEDHNLYVYEETDTEIIKGVIAPTQIPFNRRWIQWKMEYLNCNLKLKKDILKNNYIKLQMLNEKLRNGFGIEMDIEESYVERDIKKEMTVSIATTAGKHIKSYKYQELVKLKGILQEIVDYTEIEPNRPTFEIKYNPTESDDDFTFLKINTDKDCKVNIDFYDIRNQNVIPFVSKVKAISTVTE